MGLLKARTAGQPGTSVNVGASSVDVLAENGARIKATFVNTSANGQVITLKLGSGTVTAGSGIVLYPQGSHEIDTHGLYTGLVRAIADAAGGTLAVTELSAGN